METKWYSDFWRLLASPFKGGIDQVVQSGTLQKGFWGTVFLWAIPYIILALFGTMLIPFLPHNEFTGLTYWLISIGWSFVMVAIGSYVYNWVITKMGGTDNVQAIMKVSWYLQGYEVLLFSIGYMIVLILMGLLDLVFDSSAIAGFVYFVGTVALIIISIWVSLELMARQVMITKMKVFIACIITSIIFAIIWAIFMALLGGCASLVGR
ncbi:MAG: hypothetical protein E7C84_06720 [Veillonella sp.]|nr:hypothetical protein [Veillonella sp.]